MKLGKKCPNHGIPENICMACKGAAEERMRIMSYFVNNLIKEDISFSEDGSELRWYIYEDLQSVLDFVYCSMVEKGDRATLVELIRNIK